MQRPLSDVSSRPESRRLVASHASRLLLRLLVAVFVPRGVVLFGLDDTIERRRGDQITAKGIYRDPVRSSHAHMVKASGLRWLGCMVLTPIAWANRVWALPFLTVLCPSERFYAQRGRRHHTLLERAWQIIRLVRRWLPGREVVFVADSSFAALEWLALVARLPRVSVITRLRLDAALYDPPPPRAPGQRGRPRLKGKRRPTLEAVLADEKTPWSTLTIDDWYGEGPREVEVATDTAVWYHAGKPPVAIRWVLIRDPQERFKPQALLSTHLEHTCEQMLAWFVRRWTMEVTFEEARAHLGMETQRQWNDRAIARTTPGAVEPLLDHYADRASADRKGSDMCAQHRMVWQNSPHVFGCDCLGAAAVVGAYPFFNVPTGDRYDSNPTRIAGALH